MSTKYTVPSLPHRYDGLQPHNFAEIMELHPAKHHHAYVDGAKAAIEKLIDARAKDDFTNVAAIERQLVFNVSGHILHSIFWRTLSPEGGGSPRGGLALAIERDFGGFTAFERQLRQTATTIMGSG